LVDSSSHTAPSQLSWSIDLEFPAEQLAESGYWREQFWTISEDVSIRNVLLHPAHQRFYDDMLYKYFLLT